MVKIGFYVAVKATYGELTHDVRAGFDGDKEIFETGVVEPREIFKDPITDDGTKKSLKGLLLVQEITEADGYGKLHHKSYSVKDQCTWEEEAKGALELVFEDGKLVREQTLDEIRLLIKR